MEKPFIPEQRNDPPEVPDEGFAAHRPFSDTAGHMVIAQAPVAKITIVEKDSKMYDFIKKTSGELAFENLTNTHDAAEDCEQGKNK